MLIDEWKIGRETEAEDWEIEANEILAELQAPSLPERPVTRREVFEAVMQAVRNERRG